MCRPNAGKGGGSLSHVTLCHCLSGDKPAETSASFELEGFYESVMTARGDH